jgi:hypothetical protein
LFAKQTFQTPIDHGTPHLQQEVRSFYGPTHWLMFPHSLVHQMIHRRLCRRAGDSKAMAVRMSVIRQAALVTHEVVSEIQQSISQALNSLHAGGGELICDLVGSYKDASHPANRACPSAIPHLVPHSRQLFSHHRCQRRICYFDNGRSLGNHLLDSSKSHTDVKPVKNLPRRILGGTLYQTGQPIGAVGEYHNL